MDIEQPLSNDFSFGMRAGSNHIEKRIKPDASQPVCDLNYLIDTAPFIVWGIDRAGVVTFSNGRNLKTTGHTSNDTAGVNVFELLADESDIAQHLCQALRGETLSAEVCDRGTVYESHYIPQVDAAGQVTGVTIYSLDITRHKNTERALRESEATLRQSEAKFRASIDYMLDPFVIFSACHTASGQIIDFKFDYANPAARRSLNRPLEEIVGQTLLTLLPRHSENGLFERYCQLFETGQPLILDNFEFEDIYRGVVKTALLDIRAVKLEDGLAITWRDLTDHRRRQADQVEVQRSLIDGVETERRRLARVLHDHAVQDLYAADYQLHAMEPALTGADSLEKLNTVQTVLHEVINTLLETVDQLRPIPLAPFGLKSTILSHLTRFTESYPHLQVEMDLEDVRNLLTDPQRLGLYRIYQGLMQNVIRHAGATWVKVTLCYIQHQVILSVKDDGQGFILPERWVTFVRVGRLGLAAAEDQMQRLGGRLEVQSLPGQGTTVTAILPIL